MKSSNYLKIGYVTIPILFLVYLFSTDNIDKALKDNQQKKFQEDYKKWYLETEIGKEFPLGEPRLKAEAAIKDADEAVSEVTEQLV